MEYYHLLIVRPLLRFGVNDNAKKHTAFNFFERELKNINFIFAMRRHFKVVPSHLQHFAHLFLEVGSSQ